MPKKAVGRASVKTNRKVIKLANSILHEFRTSKINLDILVAIINNRGFDIIDFLPKHNPDEIEIMISELDIATQIQNQLGFVCSTENLKLVFIREDLDENEKCIVLAHELGHIECNHLSNYHTDEYSVQQEYEANEFAHYLLNPSLSVTILSYLGAHKIITTIVASLLILLAVGGILLKEYNESCYYENYYVSESGERYHIKECYYISDRDDVHRITKEEFESGEYTPCKVCIPISKALQK